MRQTRVCLALKGQYSAERGSFSLSCTERATKSCVREGKRPERLWTVVVTRWLEVARGTSVLAYGIPGHGVTEHSMQPPFAHRPGRRTCHCPREQMWTKQVSEK